MSPVMAIFSSSPPFTKFSLIKIQQYLIHSSESLGTSEFDENAFNSKMILSQVLTANSDFSVMLLFWKTELKLYFLWLSCF